MTREEQIQRLAEQLQNDCHKTVEQALSKTNKVSVQDATNVWIFTKLAEMTVRMWELEDVVLPRDKN